MHLVDHWGACPLPPPPTRPTVPDGEEEGGHARVGEEEGGDHAHVGEGGGGQHP